MRMLMAVLTAGFLMVAQDGMAQSDAPAAAIDSEAVHAAFVKLVDRGEARPLFGLPQDTFWRRNGDLRVALLADSLTVSAGSLSRVATIFSEATGQDITVVETGPPPQSGTSLQSVASEADLLIVIGPRQVLAEIALAENVNKGMLARFELGTWPFMFSFAPEPGRRGVVLLADDEPPRARVASFILATVWALGGVTLGPELTGLIGNENADTPSLTPLGKAVFALFFDEGLETGMTIQDTVLRAKALLPD